MYASLAVLARLVIDPQLLGWGSGTLLTSGAESSPYASGERPASRSAGMSDCKTSYSLLESIQRVVREIESVVEENAGYLVDSFLVHIRRKHLFLHNLSAELERYSGMVLAEQQAHFRYCLRCGHTVPPYSLL